MLPFESIRPSLYGVLLALMALVSPAGAETVTFASPIYKGMRLDWCLSSGSGCGRPAALAYCNGRRFEDVASFRTEKADRAARTRMMGSDQSCMGGESCTVFASITCTEKVPYRRVFANPTAGGLRLDFCLAGGADCGGPVADAFCRARGFSDALYARADAESGRSATRALGSGEVCNGSKCRGFQQIICRAGDKQRSKTATKARARQSTQGFEVLP
jgi:hypothetical protein